jgi:hypothetical protein
MIMLKLAEKSLKISEVPYIKKPYPKMDRAFFITRSKF